MLTKRMAQVGLVAALVTAVALALPDDAEAHSWNIVTVESAGDVGLWTDIAVAPNGTLMMAYDEEGYLDLKFAFCDPALPAGCNDSGDWTKVKVDDTGNVWGYTSIAVHSNGDPMISYWDQTNHHLRFAWCDISNSVALKCDDPIDWATMTVDSGGEGDDVGRWTSIAVSSLSGNPWISYYDSTNGNLKAAVCSNWSVSPCTQESDWTTGPLDSGGDVGQYTSNGEAAGGDPIISYYDATNGDLKFAICDVDVTGTPTPTPTPTPCDDPSDWDFVTVDSTGFAGQYSSIAADNNGNPMISYQADYDLKFARCLIGTDCNQTGDWTTKVAVDTEGAVGYWTSIAAKSNGDPVISYFDDTNDDVKFAWCDDLAGTGCDEPGIDWSREVVDPSVVSGLYTSIAMRYDDVIISYTGSLDVATGWACDTILAEDADQGTDLIIVEDGGLCPVGHRILINDGGGNEECRTIIATGGEAGEELTVAPELDYDHYTYGGEDPEWVHEVASCLDEPPYPPADTDVLGIYLRFSDIIVDNEAPWGVPETSLGPATFYGEGNIYRSDPYVDQQSGLWTVDTEIKSMVLGATVGIDWREINVGVDHGLPATTGKIQELVPDTGFPAYSFFDVFFEVPDSTWGPLENCAGAEKFETYEVRSIPTRGVVYDAVATIQACEPEGGALRMGGVVPLSPAVARIGGEGGEALAPGGVGGTAEYPDVTAGADSPVDSWSGSGFNYAALGATLSAAAAALAAGAWYARRRWLA